MKIFAISSGEKTKPIQSQFQLAPRPALGVEKDFEKTSLSLQLCSGQALSEVEWNQSRPSAGNPKHEVRNPKRVERAI